MALVTRLFSRIGFVLLALGFSAQIAAACPNWNNPTVFGSHTLNAGFLPDPYVRNVTAGGTIDLRNCRPFLGPGFVVQRPDFRLFYNGTSPTGTLTFALQAASSVDTVLIVNAPDGSWHHNDDTGSNGPWPTAAVPLTNNFDSSITFVNPLPGQYDVWTGSYNQSSNNPARLYVTEFTN